MDSYSTAREVEKVKPFTVDRDVKLILDEVAQEVMRARHNHSKWNSAHEGYAVILEELDELWEEVKKNRLVRDREKMHVEARQVAAMAIRFLLDVTSVL